MPICLYIMEFKISIPFSDNGVGKWDNKIILGKINL